MNAIDPMSAYSTGEAAASRAMNILNELDRDRFIRMLCSGLYSWSLVFEKIRNGIQCTDGALAVHGRRALKLAGQFAFF